MWRRKRRRSLFRERIRIMRIAMNVLKLSQSRGNVFWNRRNQLSRSISHHFFRLLVYSVNLSEYESVRVRIKQSFGIRVSEFLQILRVFFDEWQHNITRGGDGNFFWFFNRADIMYWFSGWKENSQPFFFFFFFLSFLQLSAHTGSLKAVLSRTPLYFFI